MKKLIIIGAGGHGKVIADIAANCGYRSILFLDDDRQREKCMEYPVVGTVDEAELYIDCDFFVAIGDMNAREKIQRNLLNKGINITTLIHPSSVLAAKASVGIGTVIMAGTVINPDSVIGDGCIINTGSTIDHDNMIEDYVHISVGAHLAGNVHVGKGTWIGAGAVVNNHVSICSGCMIGAGAVVLKDIEIPGTYIGVPARKLCREKGINDLSIKLSGGGTEHKQNRIIRLWTSTGRAA